MPLRISRPRDPVHVRSQVLTTALKLFAERGYADTSLREISKAADVSHPLILHHFGSKEELYTAVKREVVEGYGKRFPKAAHHVNRPINIRAELKRLMTYLGENELALKFCARVRLEGDFGVWPGEPDLFSLIQQRIEVAQKQGKVRDDVQPALLCIMLFGLIIFWLDGRHCFTERFGKLPNNATYLSNVLKILEQGLLPPSRWGTEPTAATFDAASC